MHEVMPVMRGAKIFIKNLYLEQIFFFSLNHIDLEFSHVQLQIGILGYSFASPFVKTQNKIKVKTKK